MALPKMNEVSKYTLKIPSTGQEVTYRPFLVKEQKILLVAAETGENSELIHAILSTIKSCVYDDIDVNVLPTFDIEYIFTQIRARSVGEESEIVMECGECKSHNVVTIPLDKINIDVNNKINKIDLTDNYKLILKYPTYKDLEYIVNTNSESERIFNMIIVCLDKLLTEEENINFKDETIEDKEEFINNLTPAQFEKLTEFINNIPSLEYNSDFICTNCEIENKYNIKGLKDFF